MTDKKIYFVIGPLEKMSFHFTRCLCRGISRLPNGFFTAEEKTNTLLPNRRCISIFRFLKNIFTFWQQHFDETRDFSNHLKPLFMCLLKTTSAPTCRLKLKQTCRWRKGLLICAAGGTTITWVIVAVISKTHIKLKTKSKSNNISEFWIPIDWLSINSCGC